MPFIENQGQIADERVKFYLKTFGGSLYVTDAGEMVYFFSQSGLESSGWKWLCVTI